MGLLGSLFCCFPRSGSRTKKSKKSNDHSSSEENSLLDHAHARNPDTADTRSITSFGNAEGSGKTTGNKAYGATGQDEERAREEDEREREERERERLNAIAGQAGNRMLSLNRPSSPLTNHTQSPQSSRPASPTFQPHDTNSQHSTEPSTAAPGHAVKQVNLGLTRTSSGASSGRGKRGGGARKPTSLRRREVKTQQDQAVTGTTESVKVEPTQPKPVARAETVTQPDVGTMTGQVSTVESTVKEDPIVVEASTSTLHEPPATAPSASKDPIPDTTASEPVVQEPQEPSLVVPALPVNPTETIPSHSESDKPSSYAAAAAAAAEPTPVETAPSAPSAPSAAPTGESSKLGLDLHGSEPSAPAAAQRTDVQQPSSSSPSSSSQPPLSSFAQVAAAASAQEIDQPSATATPDDSEPVTPVPEVETEGTTPPPATEAAEEGNNAAKTGKPRAKGKGGKGKKKKGKK
ncbi:hypothetical protein NliqN6_2817 [Naganishia liquefaciens]|uniref:Uncharacterized protein n=1 Tax=Naganishia liquefaciens TaxID=104408 RepID=A0A8H3TTK0_9TREE|nr:hypothetical protein NliqN6_2817 [Naganishia liquefaciens]